MKRHIVQETFPAYRQTIRLFLLSGIPSDRFGTVKVSPHTSFIHVSLIKVKWMYSKTRISDYDFSFS